MASQFVFVKDVYNVLTVPEDPASLVLQADMVCYDGSGGMFGQTIYVTVLANDNANTIEGKIYAEAKAQAEALMGVAVAQNDVYQYQIRRG